MYSKLLGHQNHKQKIQHVKKLKEENVSLKQVPYVCFILIYTCTNNCCLCISFKFFKFLIFIIIIIIDIGNSSAKEHSY